MYVYLVNNNICHIVYSFVILCTVYMYAYAQGMHAH